MVKYGIPTARYKSFESYEPAKEYLDNLDSGSDLVLNVDGLAAGKAVVLPETREEARVALEEMMLGVKFGDAGKTIIEERLAGAEISVLTFSDGKTHKSLPPGQDHKRIFDGNEGPNTGGMGACAPVPFVTDVQMTEIDRTIIQPTSEGMRSEGNYGCLTYLPLSCFVFSRPTIRWATLYRNYDDAKWTQSSGV
jgi:phosphoribosylamine--glycine ligase/phosphoribosylformylglycinamidine cyclo-ligase